MSLFRKMIDEALAANLTQNQLRCFLVLLNQTMGYGKTSDNLTDNRFVELSGIRKDRMNKALTDLICDNELFTCEESSEFQYKYSIHPKFLNESETPFFTPHIPKNGINFQKTETVSETQSYTEYNPLHHSTLQQPTSAVPEQANDSTALDNECSRGGELVYPDSLNLVEKEFAEKLMQGIDKKTAQDVLDVLDLKIKNNEVKKSKTGLLVALLKAAKNNCLDNTELQKQREAQQQKQQTVKKQTDPAYQLQQKQQEHRLYLQSLVNYKQFPSIAAAEQIHGKIEDIRL